MINAVKQQIHSYAETGYSLFHCNVCFAPSPSLTSGELADKCGDWPGRSSTG